MKATIDPNLEGKERFEFLRANKKVLFAEKKMSIKHADPFFMPIPLKSEDPNKAALEEGPEGSVKAVINSCYWFDSHEDVHVEGIWNKSVQEIRDPYLLQEHSMTFTHIITDKVKPFVRKITWKELGVNFPGQTEILVFDCELEKDRNPYMYEQYKANRVKNHSVGMRYIDLELAIDDEDYKEEFAVFNKYINKIANKQEAIDNGYFFAIKQAAIIEGSAVPLGSNPITPVLSSNLKQFQRSTVKDEPLAGTHSDQPFDLDSIIKNTRFIY